MLLNGISHDESSAKPGYTPEGQAAGTNGNVAVSSEFNAKARSHVELWMTGPFHAVGILRPNLKTVGFGKCDSQTTSPWRSGATLDVLHGLGSGPAQTSPILWPGDGTTTSLNRFVVESPDPLPFCGWSGPAGLPVMALMPETVAGPVSASISGPAGPVATCALSALNTNGVAQAILAGNNVVVAIPRDPLAPGTYTVSISSAHRNVSWSFTVDPAAANGQTAPPAAAPSGPAVGFRAITPVRLVDTREHQGAERLAAGVSQRIQVTGDVVPAGASAISANFTVTGTDAGGYLTAWNCSADRPVIATLNFERGATVPNGATVPLDSAGGVCVFSPTGTDVIVDVNGYYASSGPLKFTTISPVRVMDTREGLGGSGHLAAGQTVSLQIGGRAGVPSSATAVTLDVASVNAGAAGYVTVWPCDQPQPFTASLNPQPGHVKPNLVLSPLAADGTVCFYTLNDVDLVVDATGYLSTTSSVRFTATVPFRFTDTRDRFRVSVNAGTTGNALAAGQVLTLQIAGQRGVPADAKAVSVNIAVTGATAPGFITAWPCGDRPNTSNVNYDVDAAISNGAQLPLSANGQLCVYTLSQAHVIIDVNGWWS
jgi:hypothetical protein